MGVDDPVVDGIVILPIVEDVDNVGAAKCGSPADTYAAAKFGSVPVFLLNKKKL